MWVIIAIVVVIALLVVYLDRRGASGAGDNFHNAEAETLPWLSAKHGDIKKRP